MAWQFISTILPDGSLFLHHRFYNALANALEDEFGADKLNMVDLGDPGMTGNFEVTVNGKLIHSKTTMGHGKCTEESETKAIIAYISNLISEN